MIRLKKVSAVCLSAAMILQSFSYTMSFAEEDAVKEMTTKVGDFTFTYIPDSPKKGECTLYSVSDSDEQDRIKRHNTLEIPEKLGDYTVTVVGEIYEPITKNYETDEVKLTTVKLSHSIRQISKLALTGNYIKLSYLCCTYKDEGVLLNDSKK